MDPTTIEDEAAKEDQIERRGFVWWACGESQKMTVSVALVALATMAE